MCGIAGIYNFKDKQVDSNILARMADAMRHRGPDAGNCFVDNNMGFAHRRLSIVDLRDAANQPFIDNSGRYVIVFNGEIYNYKAIRSLLPDYEFKTSGDTEVLLAAYIKWGKRCLEKIKGMFAFAIWDSELKEMVIVRDRLGVKPLYFFKDGDRLVFASELRAMLASGFIERRLNRNGLLDFLSFQSIGHPHSAITGIMQVEAGSILTISDGTVSSSKYWDIINLPKTDFDFADTKATHRHIRNVLTNAVTQRLVSDVPVGAFLSGGIDSSAVVGLMAETSGLPPNTFTIGFSEREFDESGYAEIVAGKFSTKHTNIRLEPTIFLDELHNALDAMDSPTADGINTYVVSKAIKAQGITVALSGIGGDELFAGYPFFMQFIKLQRANDLYSYTGPFRKMAAEFMQVTNSNKFQRIANLLKASSVDIEHVYPISRQILSGQMINKFTTLGNHALEDTDLFKKLSAAGAAMHRLPLLSQVSIAEYIGYAQHTLLKDTDQMSMASSLEVREPFFDHELIEFVLSIPDKLKYPVYPKSLLVESLSGLLPNEIVHRDKKGFTFPWSVWMKKELREFCEEKLKNISQRSFIRPDALLKYWNRFLANDNTTRWTELWIFVVLEHWMEKNGISE